MTAWHEEPIDKSHDRQAFDCGEAALNEFLQHHARKSHELGGAKTFLAIDDAGNKARGRAEDLLRMHGDGILLAEAAHIAHGQIGRDGAQQPGKTEHQKQAG